MLSVTYKHPEIAISVYAIKTRNGQRGVEAYCLLLLLGTSSVIDLLTGKGDRGGHKNTLSFSHFSYFTFCPDFQLIAIQFLYSTCTLSLHILIK